MTDSFEHEVAVFNAARRLDAQARAAYLQETCAGDAALRGRVEELLRASEEAGGFLEAPAPGALRPPDAVSSPGVARGVTMLEKPGARIGRYKLLQQIGEGGCGVVYMAEQEEPVRRRVALKVIKLGMDTRQVIGRFEAERQALALMDHPNIAKVHDAGATDTGRPFFVMELVRGTKITDYCDENSLSSPERLALFMQVCLAIQHAHQKGIIHRDIKPSNILVTLNDGVAVPKVIDFGIAKATQGRLTDHTLFTAFEQFIGTPAYMSPEQAAMTSLDIDTRSDIYSLGVLLYELLTGKTPFDTKTLKSVGLDAMRRSIQEHEPLRPSIRLETIEKEELTETARQRRTEPVKLIHLLSGDLDWIVMKCLEKDRARRYETANGLAADLKRHLNNEAVLARPPSRLYRLQKLVRRNKGTFAMISAMLGILLAGAIASTLYAIRATRAEKRAGTEASRSQQVFSFLVNTLGAGTDLQFTNRAIEVHTVTQLRPEDLGQAETMFGEILALQKKRFGDKSEQTARTLGSIASIQESQGHLQQAELVRRKELLTWTQLGFSNSNMFARSLHCLAELVSKRGDLPAAQELHRRAIGITLTNALSELSELTEELRWTSVRGQLYASFGLYTDAVPDLTRTIQLEPDNHRNYYMLAPVLIELGNLAEYQRVSQAMLFQFGETTNTVWAERTARTCLLVPWTNDLRHVSRLAEIANQNAAPGDPDLAYFQFVKALAEYRLGHAATAVEWAQKSLNQGASWAASYNSSREVVTYTVEAMAYCRLRDEAQAKASLMKAEEIMEREAPKRGGLVIDTLLVDWMTCQILLREARLLIQSAAIKADSPL
jgi:serine/threonine protein kinase